MSAGRTVFAYTCVQCVVEIKRTKQYFLISKTLANYLLVLNLVHKKTKARINKQSNK